MSHRRSELPQINAGSMADIAFLLLIFFLVTTTIESEAGIMAKLPPFEENPEPVKLLERNVLNILINADDKIMLNGKLVEIDQVKSEAKTFIANPNDLAELPQKKKVDVHLLGYQFVSKHIISLQNDNGTSYDTYIQVRNELASAYNELRDEAAQMHFQVNYDFIKESKDKEKLKALKQLIPQRISEAEPNRR